MNYKQLEALIYVTRHGTFKQAAEALNGEAAEEDGITPESIQYRLKQLEQELGVALYRKRQGSSRVMLTREGQLFLREALDVYGRMGEWRSMFLQSERGRMTFASTQSEIIHRLLEPLRDFHARHPKVQIRALTGTAAEMEKAVHEGQLDFAISTREPESPELEYVPWKRSEMVLVMPKGHALSGRTDITVTEIADHPLLLLLPDVRGDRDLADEAFRRAGIKRPNIVLEASNSEILLAYVEAGLGIAITAETNVQNTSRKVEWISLERQVGRTEVGLLVREGQFLALRAREFILSLDPKFADWFTARDARLLGENSTGVEDQPPPAKKPLEPLNPYSNPGTPRPAES